MSDGNDYFVKPKFDPMLPYTDWKDIDTVERLKARFAFAAFAYSVKQAVKQ